MTRQFTRLLPIIALLAYSTLGCSLISYQFNGKLITPPVPAPNFRLASDHGPVQLSDFKDKIVLLYFAYTFCPDACPTTMVTLKRTLNLLGPEAQKVQVVLVSVDPKRDTPERLGEYARYYHPTFIGITESQAMIDQVTGQYQIKYQINPPEDKAHPENYTVDHPSIILVIDRNGNRFMNLPQETTPENIASDLRQMLR
jgi:protein SCO1/2